MLSWSLWLGMNFLNPWARRKLQLRLYCLIRLVQLSSFFWRVKLWIIFPWNTNQRLFYKCIVVCVDIVLNSLLCVYSIDNTLFLHVCRVTFQELEIGLLMKYYTKSVWSLYLNSILFLIYILVDMRLNYSRDPNDGVRLRYCMVPEKWWDWDGWVATLKTE